MRRPLSTPFGAILRTELLLNSKRVAPYAMAVLFAGNAVLWWGAGAATHYGWATNSEYYILRNYAGFSFLTLPFFTALLMGDPVARDFRLRVDPLLLSKPITRAEYLLGKFFGNFLTLVCCQLCFTLTLFALQAHRPAWMVVLPVRVTPYFKHFLVLVVISHMLLAALFFAVGSLTRNVKLVHGLGVAFYPAYIAWQLLLKNFPARWRVVLDPLGLNRGGGIPMTTAPELLDRLSFSYDSDLLINRLLVLLGTAACLGLVHQRFGRETRGEAGGAGFTTLALSPPPEMIQSGDTFAPANSGAPSASFAAAVAAKSVPLPVVTVSTQGPRAALRRFAAALGVEFRLLRAERSLVVLPLATLLCCLDVAVFEPASGVAPSAAYAATAAGALLLFLFGITVFYAGEAIHRDRELRIEPVLWAMPAGDGALPLSKFSAVSLVSLSLVVLVFASSFVIQLVRGHAPVELLPYLVVGTLILAPGVLFVAAAAVVLNVFLRDKHLAHAACVALGGLLFYLYSQGYVGWLYNPLLYRLWTYSDLSGTTLTRILLHRLYTLAAASLCLSLALLCFPRAAGRRRGALLALLISAAALVVTGLSVGV
jgi:ABC-type transport system involved in multi-copper enzyme maturation permease subunit